MIDTTQVGALWSFRAGGELEARERFARLATELAAAAALPAVVDMARSAAEEEGRHHRLCIDLAAAYGVTHRDEPRVATPVGDPSMSPRRRVLAEVVSLCCIGETLATTVLARTMEATTAPDVRHVVHEILGDEVSHSRLGWAHLAAESAAGHVGFVGELLPRMLAAGIPTDLFAAQPAGRDAEALRAYGVLPRAELVEIFQATMREVIFPGFEQMGIDVAHARAWLARHG